MREDLDTEVGGFTSVEGLGGVSAYAAPDCCCQMSFACGAGAVLSQSVGINRHPVGRGQTAAECPVDAGCSHSRVVQPEVVGL